MLLKKNKFPKDFLWGASISAFQAEGAYNQDGKGLSIQDVKKYGEQIADFKVASDFYHKFKDDIKLLKEMGIKSFRFSIAWSRIIPDGDGEINEKGIKFYEELIDELIKNDIEPIPTLYHFDLPLSLSERGGWSNRELTVNAYLKYVETLFKHFSQKVKYWITFNEQNVIIMIGNKVAMLNGGKSSLTEKELYQQSHHMFIAQAKAVELLRKYNSNAKIGPALNNVCIYPNSNKPEDYLAAQNASVMRNWYYLDAIVRGIYNPIAKKYFIDNDLMPEILNDDFEILKKGKPDFLSINYYTSGTVQENIKNTSEQVKIDQQTMFDINGLFSYAQNDKLEKTEYGWNTDPVGFRITLREVYERYNLPLMISENGIGLTEELENDTVNDMQRIEYYSKHIEQLQLAISEGVEVIAYNPWSAIDVVSSHQGFKKRYGFIFVDRTEKDLKELKRYKKKSFFWYKDLISKNGDIF
ncbi:glycoside hydrolase family 1 protein [Spiroplasma floricola]|uniref:6-phospho-beta-glucosidase n=1 Tax=Spiroplasma floricola 23-6 TaxID=1336749 RepID=A0A2K8SFX7_9MOLU|nr:glycoside hydrolase family 1 protein [Spiroplasma floricola]AUB31730.1 6-phospho-beta-glucosidase [Spiroplasma floricola 23-6]